MEQVILYSTGCPKCIVLEKKLNMAGIEYTKTDDVQVLYDLGILSVPVLKVDDAMFDFKAAIDWVNYKSTES